MFLPPTGDTGLWLINLEELPSCVPMVQAALYQLALERKVGEYELPDGASLIACGNREGDRGVVHRMPTPLSEPKQKGFARWHGDDAARRAVTNNRTRLLSGVAREAFKLRAEIVERSFAHNLDRGGMRRTWLRGRENVHKRYLLHVAGHNLSLLMRQLIGAGTPKEAVAGGIGALFVLVTPAGAVLVVQIVLIVSEDGETAFAAICFAVA